MEIRDEMKQLAKKINNSESKLRSLLAERDEITRRAADAPEGSPDRVTWREMQTIFGLSPRGLQIVLSRTKE